MNRSEIRAQHEAARAQQAAEAERTKAIVQPTDLRKITRNPDKCLTGVSLFPDGDDRNVIDWITCGLAELQHFERKNTWLLKVFLTAGVTDFEHDSAYALQLPLIGLSFKSLYYHRTTFVAWVDPNDIEGFRVPRPGYNPMKLEGAYRCKDRVCLEDDKNGHMIVPEGYYAGPPNDKELYRAVRGKRVEISVGPVFKEE